MPTIAANASEDDEAAELERERIRLENRARPRVDGGVTLLPDLYLTIPLSDRGHDLVRLAGGQLPARSPTS